MKIPFNKPYLMDKGLQNIIEAFSNGHVSGDGPFTAKCHDFLTEYTHAKKVLLTHSCTAALEMAAILAEVGPGDEVIMPSYTFVSTANAFVLRGAIPVFVDIRPDTLNIDETLVERAITQKTKAIVVVHYAGVACEMDTICALAEKYKLLVIEDAAQALGSTYKGRQLGSIGHIAALSFHETKNLISGEGGALLLNDERFFERSEIIREKGTDRSKFFRGQVDKYTWVDQGSSFLPSDILAAFLFAQLEAIESIIGQRKKLWQIYDDAFRPYERDNLLRCPCALTNFDHNAHIYYLVFNDLQRRNALIQTLKDHNITAVFHYIPLHSSPAGLKYARTSGDMTVTESTSDCLVRLPLYHEMDQYDQKKIIDVVLSFLESMKHV